MSLTRNAARVQLAYMFGCAAWGHGYASEACEAAIGYVRARARSERVEVYVDTRNERSIRLAERLGMRRVRTIIGADHFKGSASDEYQYRLSFANEAVDER